VAFLRTRTRMWEAPIPRHRREIHRAGAGPLVPPATGVHELLECPICLSLSHGGDDETGDGGDREMHQILMGRRA
jgi:hypothetical protein